MKLHAVTLSAQTSPVIEARKIVLSIEGRCLLDEANVQAQAGEVVAIIGPNGAGKSTLLKILAGDIQPLEGEVWLAGKPLPAWNIRQAALMRAVLAQEAHLTFSFSAQQVVEFGRFAQKLGALDKHDKTIAREALHLLGASDLAGRDYTTLSGGEKARVQCARVLAQIWEPWEKHPRALLLDEPTAALDLRHQATVLAAVQGFAKKQNVAVIAVVHDINLAARFADRIVWMMEGRVICQGSPKQVITTELLQTIYGVPASVIRHPQNDLPIETPH